MGRKRWITEDEKRGMHDMCLGIRISWRSARYFVLMDETKPKMDYMISRKCGWRGEAIQ